MLSICAITTYLRTQRLPKDQSQHLILERTFGLGRRSTKRDMRVRVLLSVVSRLQAAVSQITLCIAPEQRSGDLAWPAVHVLLGRLRANYSCPGSC
jgi:hypothetical protein